MRPAVTGAREDFQRVKEFTEKDDSLGKVIGGFGSCAAFGGGHQTVRMVNRSSL